MTDSGGPALPKSIPAPFVCSWLPPFSRKCAIAFSWLRLIALRRGFPLRIWFALAPVGAEV
eukprot:5242994-Pyramimonas_sp.AAC.1